MTETSLSPLQSFFASNFPLLQQQQEQEGAPTLPFDVQIQIVSDNAKGLRRKDSLSERRRLYEAQQERLGDLFVTAPPSPRICRWESELPDVVHPTLPPLSTPALSISLPPLSSPLSPSTATAATPTGVLEPPKIPRRRTSVEEDLPLPAQDEEVSTEFQDLVDRAKKAEAEDDHTVSTAASTTGHTRQSSGSDFPLAPPRRRTSCLEWLEQVEANESAANAAPAKVLAVENSSNGFVELDKTQHQLASTRLSRRDVSRSSLNDNPNSLDNHVRDLRSSHTSITVGTAKGDDGLKKRDSMDKNRKSSVKHAPRRPRRMKSIEWLPTGDDSMTSVTMDSSSSSHQDNNDNSLRLSISDSIKSVLNQIQQQEEKDDLSPSSKRRTSRLTSSEQIILKESVKGVVGALRRNSQESTSESPAARCKAATTTLVAAL